MESNKKYVIGLDFGTDSCRALVVDTYTGREMATGVSFYPRWKAGLYCDAHNNRYRQHPLDYIESMIEAVHIALSDLKEEEIASICGLCFDTTGLGGIMKVYREWRISGDTQWMKDLFPAVKKSLDYCIRTWDPLHKGYLEEPHHNTYDIEFWGPDGMCTSFYLGALTAFIEMGKELKQPVKEYTALLSKGKKYMETALFDGEYFIQKIQWEGLQAPNPVDVMSFGGSYSDEALKLLKEEGPKYQYGTGCLSDGILGMWMASVCGLDEVLDNEKVRSHLVAVHKYNLKHDLVDHFNPQRPVYACGKDGGLLLCTWPKGGMLSLPFVYSNEVWTGIEYQVASHLMMKGEVEKGLDIVRECRERYDGRVRNPFNEIECGHWYARAMASYGMLQGLTGVRYDAVDKNMYIDSKIGDFKSFISTDTGFGTIEWKAGKPVLNVVYGNIDVKRYNVSGKIVD